jgi:hypothetical protein
MFVQNVDTGTTHQESNARIVIVSQRLGNGWITGKEIVSEDDDERDDVAEIVEHHPPDPTELHENTDDVTDFTSEPQNQEQEREAIGVTLLNALDSLRQATDGKEDGTNPADEVAHLPPLPGKVALVYIHTINK